MPVVRSTKELRRGDRALPGDLALNELLTLGAADKGAKDSSTDHRVSSDKRASWPLESLSRCGGGAAMTLLAGALTSVGTLLSVQGALAEGALALAGLTLTSPEVCGHGGASTSFACCSCFFFSSRSRRTSSRISCTDGARALN